LRTGPNDHDASGLARSARWSVAMACVKRELHLTVHSPGSVICAGPEAKKLTIPKGCCFFTPAEKMNFGDGGIGAYTQLLERCIEAEEGDSS
jgi:hypothetical protein